MKNELRIFFTALMFYTRIPVPKWTGYSEDNLNRATRYFPLVGVIVGVIGAIVFVGSHMVLPTSVSVIAALIAMILLTGAFHEDALADFSDGFGGGYTPEKILSIMKDSFIGTYGTLSLVLLIIGKFVLLSEMDPLSVPCVLIAAHALSRLMAVLMIFTSEYVRADALSKAKPIGKKNTIGTLLIAILIGIAPLVLIPLQNYLIIFPMLIMILLYFRHYVHKVMGGYTGDILGTLQQLCEVGFYVSFLMAERIL